jgi:hypothetical protein
MVMFTFHKRFYSKMTIILPENWFEYRFLLDFIRKLVFHKECVDFHIYINKLY